MLACPSLRICRLHVLSVVGETKAFRGTSRTHCRFRKQIRAKLRDAGINNVNKSEYTARSHPFYSSVTKDRVSMPQIPPEKKIAVLIPPANTTITTSLFPPKIQQQNPVGEVI